MKIKGTTRSIVILILLLTGITATLLSMSFFISLDHVVNVDLYQYDLRFASEWAEEYWANSRMMMGSLAVAMATIGISIAFNLIHIRTAMSSSKKLVICALLVVGISMIGLSAFFFYRVDHVVHNHLYGYGLKFSLEWAERYWSYARLTLSQFGLTILTSVTCIALLLPGQQFAKAQRFLAARTSGKMSSTTLICIVLLSVGAIALAFSVFYSSQILAFIGLGLAFWGAVLLYVTPQEYVKSTLLDSMTLTFFATLDEFLKHGNYLGSAVYLPPKYLRDFESSRVYVSKERITRLPTPEHIQKKENESLSTDHDSTLLTPPGAGLEKSFEKALGTSFTKITLNQLENYLPKLLVEDLEIVENIETKITNQTIQVTIENSIYKNTTRALIKSTPTIKLLGCPVASALACSIAKASGHPVAIRKYATNEDASKITIEYHVIEEQSSEQLQS